MSQENYEESQCDRQESQTKLSKEEILFVNQSSELSTAQKEFNRLMKRLANQRAKYEKEQEKLDDLQHAIIEYVMPLIERCNLINCEIAFRVRAALDRINFSNRQRHLLNDLLLCKVQEILDDTIGVAEEDLEKLLAIAEELAPNDVVLPPTIDVEMLDAMKKLARDNGIELDFEEDDFAANPHDFEKKLVEFMEELDEKMKQQRGTALPDRKRKPTKAQLEKQRKRFELEEAKQRDLKSLYKQLAKVIHPDLESDPQLKLHKEAWMKRLTVAHAEGDLGELLRIEMEWLGEESENLGKASEEKLLIYQAVLREQIRDLKQKTDTLFWQPQYNTLSRFISPPLMRIPSLSSLGKEWGMELQKCREILRELEQGDTAVRHTLKDWAETHHQVILKERNNFGFGF
jgi:hypothetical protein